VLEGLGQGTEDWTASPRTQMCHLCSSRGEVLSPAPRPAPGSGQVESGVRVAWPGKTRWPGGGLRGQTAAGLWVGSGPGKNHRERGPGPTFCCDSGLTQCHF
jgi:hypothetical protein